MIKKYSILVSTLLTGLSLSACAHQHGHTGGIQAEKGDYQAGIL